MLAKAKTSVLSHGKKESSEEPTHDENSTTMIPLKDFQTYLINQPDFTFEGIYGKSVEHKEPPHVVTPGKQKGEYRCEKNCPHFNGIRICSHTVVTAQQNGELLDFLTTTNSHVQREA